MYRKHQPSLHSIYNLLRMPVRLLEILVLSTSMSLLIVNVCMSTSIYRQMEWTWITSIHSANMTVNRKSHQNRRKNQNSIDREADQWTLLKQIGFRSTRILTLTLTNSTFFQSFSSQTHHQKCIFTLVSPLGSRMGMIQYVQYISEVSERGNHWAHRHEESF